MIQNPGLFVVVFVVNYRLVRKNCAVECIKRATFYQWPVCLPVSVCLSVSLSKKWGKVSSSYTGQFQSFDPLVGDWNLPASRVRAWNLPANRVRDWDFTSPLALRVIVPVIHIEFHAREYSYSDKLCINKLYQKSYILFAAVMIAFEIFLRDYSIYAILSCLN